jgi:hypothetical protein
MTIGILLNYCFPFFLIVSIALLAYALVTFIKSRVEHSRPLLRKSFKIGIFPLLYILGIFVPMIGKWAIYHLSEVITLQDNKQAQPFYATLRLTAGKVTALVLSTVKDSIVMKKTL